MNVKKIVELSPETAVPIKDLKDKLSIFEDLKSPNAWTSHLRRSPSKWKVGDGEIVVNVIHNSLKNPVKRPFNPAKLKRKPKGMECKKWTIETILPDELELNLFLNLLPLNSIDAFKIR